MSQDLEIQGQSEVQGQQGVNPTQWSIPKTGDPNLFYTPGPALPPNFVLPSYSYDFGVYGRTQEDSESNVSRHFSSPASPSGVLVSLHS